MQVFATGKCRSYNGERYYSIVDRWHSEGIFQLHYIDSSDDYCPVSVRLVALQDQPIGCSALSAIYRADSIHASSSFHKIDNIT